MANKITAQILGGQPRIIDNAKTVQDVMNQLDIVGSYTIAVNGLTAEPTDAIPEGNNVFVSFAEKVKGA